MNVAEHLQETIRPGHIVFISPMCLLDSGSGAAVSVKTWLEILCRLMDDDAAYTAAAVPAGGQDFSFLAVLL